MGLKVENVTKKFAEKVAVNNISFEMEKPGVFGLLGTNGARKDNNDSNDSRYYEKRFRRNYLEWKRSCKKKC